MMCGQPLISWTIAAAQSAHSLDKIVVSTDDKEIANIALNMGISVPFMRPPELAQDDTPAIESVLHALSLVKGFDSVVLLQPTSPLRTSADIDAIVELASAQRASSVVSVCTTREPLQWTYTLQDDGTLRPSWAVEMVNRRQDAAATYTLNGALYYLEIPWLLACRTFIDEETLPYIMPPERSIDIDSTFDWTIAEFLLGKGASGYAT
jgi:CMP-N-acetylneuraminic acid synthetase